MVAGDERSGKTALRLREPFGGITVRLGPRLRKCRRATIANAALQATSKTAAKTRLRSNAFPTYSVRLMQIDRLLVAVRVAHGLTQRELAERLG
jgi:hypothetical protein